MERTFVWRGEGRVMGVDSDECQVALRCGSLPLPPHSEHIQGLAGREEARAMVRDGISVLIDRRGGVESPFQHSHNALRIDPLFLHFFQHERT